VLTAVTLAGAILGQASNLRVSRGGRVGVDGVVPRQYWCSRICLCLCMSDRINIPEQALTLRLTTMVVCRVLCPVCALARLNQKRCRLHQPKACNLYVVCRVCCRVRLLLLSRERVRLLSSRPRELVPTSHRNATVCCFQHWCYPVSPTTWQRRCPQHNKPTPCLLACRDVTPGSG
jgi:hypothetical protein